MIKNDYCMKNTIVTYQYAEYNQKQDLPLSSELNQ